MLAAGLSERMGRPKALLRWGTSTLVEFQLQQLMQVEVGQIVVVLGSAVDRVRRLISDSERVQVVYNPDYQTGRSSSIRAGARAVEGVPSAIIVASVDQPCQVEVLSPLLRAAESLPGRVFVPTHGGRRGHPIVLRGSLLSELSAVTEADMGLRAVVTRRPEQVVEVPVESEMVLWNLNRPEEHRRAHLDFFGRAPDQS